MGENFQSLAKDINFQNQETQDTLRQINMKKKYDYDMHRYTQPNYWKPKMK